MAGIVTGAPPASATDPPPPYTDVTDPQSPTYTAISWLKAEGYAAGATTAFRPADPLTRGEAVTMLWKANGRVGYPATSYTDLTSALQNPVRWAVGEGVIADGTTFDATGTVSRTFFLSWLFRMDLEPTGHPTYSSSGWSGVGTNYIPMVNWAKAEGIMPTPAANVYNGSESLTRETAALYEYNWANRTNTYISFTAARDDINRVTLTWDVENAMYGIAPQVAIDPLGDMARTRGCGAERAIEGPCDMTVRTDRTGTINYSLTVPRNGGATMPSFAHQRFDMVNVSRPVDPVPTQAPRVSLSAFGSGNQTLSWTTSGAPAGSFVRVYPPESYFPLATEYAVTGSTPVPFPSADPDNPADPIPADTWTIKLCRAPVNNQPENCSHGAQVTYDPEPARFNGPYRVFATAGQPLDLSWNARGTSWLIDRSQMHGGSAEPGAANRHLVISGADVTPGIHTLKLTTCNGSCSTPANRFGEVETLQVVVGSATSVAWQSPVNVGSAFSVVRADTLTQDTTGSPLDVAFGFGSVWGIGEFATNAAKVNPSTGAVSAPDTPLAHALIDMGGNEVLQDVRPYINPINRCRDDNNQQVDPGRSPISALGERVITTDRFVWFTQGGRLFSCDWMTEPRNYSRIVRFDPEATDDEKTEGDDRFCVVHVPGDDGEVVGLTHQTGSEHHRIWYTAPLDHQVGWFYEDDIQCSNLLDYEDSGDVTAAANITLCAGSVTEHCVHRLPTMTSGSFQIPTHLSLDESTGSLWMTDYLGSAIGRYQLTDTNNDLVIDADDDVAITGTTQPQRFPMPTDVINGFQWQIRAANGQVYLVEYGDDQIVWLNPTLENATNQAVNCSALVSGANPCIRELTLPMEHATVRAHSIDVADGKLWFTVAHEISGVADDTSAYIGWIDLTTWQMNADHPELETRPTGQIYQGFDLLPDPPGRRHRSPRGIDVDPATGRVALAEMGGEVDILTPTF
jgi:hypothetical protein